MVMDIWIDGRAACAEQRTGKGQWALRLVAELLARRSVTICIADETVPELWKPYEESIRRFSRGPLWHLQVSSAVKKALPIYIAPTSFIVPALLPRLARCVLMVHDLIAFHKEPHERKARIIETCTLPRALAKASCVLVTSEATKHDLLAKFPMATNMPISCVHAGPTRDRVAASQPDGRTILCPATLCPRKNQLRLIQAYMRLSPDLRSHYRIVLVGARGWQDREILRAARSTCGVEWRQYVSDTEYDHLLSTCAILAYPSLYEGFGLPVLDALQRGTPVLTSARGSLREVAGDCAVLVDPECVEDISRGLAKLLGDPTLRQQLRAQGPVRASRYCWEATVDATLQAIDTLQARRQFPS
jgi:glycosyltransferase involved in cell wall biosynthesis